jgi:hypothetical protein
MASAMIILIGGLAIVFMYPQLSVKYRVLIGLFVTFYFFLRMAQTIMAIKRERRRAKGELKGLMEAEDDGSYGPKSP